MASLGRKSAAAWIAESMPGNVAGTTFLVEVQGSSAADALIARLKSAGWETSNKEYDGTEMQEIDYDGGSVSDDIYSILVFRTDVDYEDDARAMEALLRIVEG